MEMISLDSGGEPCKVGLEVWRNQIQLADMRLQVIQIELETTDQKTKIIIRVIRPERKIDFSHGDVLVELVWHNITHDGLLFNKLCWLSYSRCATPLLIGRLLTFPLPRSVGVHSVRICESLEDCDYPPIRSLIVLRVVLNGTGILIGRSTNTSVKLRARCARRHSRLQAVRVRFG